MRKISSISYSTHADAMNKDELDEILCTIDGYIKSFDKYAYLYESDIAGLRDVLRREGVNDLFVITYSNYRDLAKEIANRMDQLGHFKDVKIT